MLYVALVEECRNEEYQAKKYEHSGQEADEQSLPLTP